MITFLMMDLILRSQQIDRFLFVENLYGFFITIARPMTEKVMRCLT